MRRLRILLVEDDIVISALLAELLTEIGHYVCGMVTTETEAVAAAERNVPNLMIFDVHLRTGNGISAVAIILQRCAMPHILMTGRLLRIIPANVTVLQKHLGTASLVAALDRVAWQFSAP